VRVWFINFIIGKYRSVSHAACSITRTEYHTRLNIANILVKLYTPIPYFTLA